MEAFIDETGTPVLWVFKSPGKYWKSRWVAFTNSDEFTYFKGEEQAVRAWAADYMERIKHGD